MNEPLAKPLPVPTPLSQPYWDGLRAGQLLLQACTGCGVLRHYPRLLCDRCYSDGVRWQAADGRGVIHSWTVAHHAFHAGFAPDLPYTLVTVELREGPRALGRWLGGAPALGLPVRARIEVLDGSAELAFEPDAANR
jgi:uncharacterized protein